VVTERLILLAVASTVITRTCDRSQCSQTSRIARGRSQRDFFGSSKTHAQRTYFRAGGDHVFSGEVVSCRNYPGEACVKLHLNQTVNENLFGEEYLICMTEDPELNAQIAKRVKRGFPIAENMEGNTDGICFTLFQFGSQDSTISTPR